MGTSSSGSSRGSTGARNMNSERTRWGVLVLMSERFLGGREATSLPENMLALSPELLPALMYDSYLDPCAEVMVLLAKLDLPAPGPEYCCAWLCCWWDVEGRAEEAMARFTAGWWGRRATE